MNSIEKRILKILNDDPPKAAKEFLKSSLAEGAEAFVLKMSRGDFDEDLVDAAFVNGTIKFIESIHKYDPSKGLSLRSFFFEKLRYEVLTLRRDLFSQPASNIAHENIEERYAVVSLEQDTPVIRLAKYLVNEAIETLPPKQKMVMQIVLSRGVDTPASVIAEILGDGFNDTSVRQLKRAGFISLREVLHAAVRNNPTPIASVPARVCPGCQDNKLLHPIEEICNFCSSCLVSSSE